MPIRAEILESQYIEAEILRSPYTVVVTPEVDGVCACVDDVCVCVHGVLRFVRPELPIHMHTHTQTHTQTHIHAHETYESTNTIVNF